MSTARCDSRLNVSTISAESLNTNILKGVGFLQRLCSENNSPPHVNALLVLADEDHPATSLSKIESDFLLKKHESFAYEDTFQALDQKVRSTVYLPCPTSNDFAASFDSS